MTTPGALPTCLAILLGLALAGCGEPSGTSGAGAPVRQHTTWQTLFRRVLVTLDTRDLEGLHALLSPEGKQALERDLALFCAMLAHPEEGPRQMAKVRARWPEVPSELVERARRGEIRAGWELFMTAANPPDAKPEQGGLKIDPTRPDEATVLYRYGAGPEQPVVMRRVKGLWAVEHIGLGAR